LESDYKYTGKVGECEEKKHKFQVKVDKWWRLDDSNKANSIKSIIY